MNVSFLRITDDERNLDKRYSLVKSLQCEIKEPSSIIKPIIKVKKDALKEYASVNYCSIQAFERFYFVTNITVASGGFLEIELESDILFSVNAQVKGISALVVRQENVFDMDIIDAEMLSKNLRDVQIVQFSDTPFSVSALSVNTNECIALTVSGGA